MWWSEAFGEDVAAGGVGEEVEGPAAVGDGAADGGIRAVRGDEMFLDGGVALGVLLDGLAHGGPCGGVVAYGVHELEEVGLDDEAVVEVEVEVGAVAVGAVAEIPALEFAEGIVDAHAVPGLIEGHEEGFVHGGEEEPVVEGWLDLSFGDESFCEALLGFGVEFLEELFWGAEQSEGEEGRVDEGLGGFAEVHGVGRGGVEGGGDSSEGAVAVTVAQGGFFGRLAGGGFEFEPGCEAGEQTAESFEMGSYGAGLSLAGGGFDGHFLAEGSLFEGAQDRFGD